MIAASIGSGGEVEGGGLAEPSWKENIHGNFWCLGGPSAHSVLVAKCEWGLFSGLHQHSLASKQVDSKAAWGKSCSVEASRVLF